MNSEVLELFCQSVADVGLLSWWAVSPDGKFQLEFAGTQLSLPPLSPEGPPCGTIALRLEGLVLLQFLRKQQDVVPLDWAEQLKSDQIRPLRLTPGGFHLWFESGAQRWLQQVKDFREGDDDAVEADDLLERPVRLLLWAGEVGVAVAARRAIPVSHQGDLDWDSLPALVTGWWKYWENYWSVRETANALPWDYACEMTIPVFD